MALAAPSAVVLGALLVGCAGEAAPAGTSGGPDQDSDSNDADVVTAPITGSVGVLVIDTQKTFFDTARRRNPTVDVDDLMAKTARAFALAHENGRPLFVTYEASMSGSHAMPQLLKEALPSSAQQFIKTTFAATGQPQFMSAVEASGKKRLVTFGAETEVCVMQTMLGLRRAGFEIIAVRDGIFTEEINDGPGRRRLRQAGVVEMSMADAEAVIANEAPSPAPSTSEPPVILRPLETAFVLNDVAGIGGADPNATQKRERLKELFYLSEWFQRSVFAADPAAAEAALPADLKAILKRPIQRLADRPASVTQVVIAGGRAGIAALVADQKTKGDVQLVEDALVGTSDLEALYESRSAVPTTYKSLYYELTVSVDDAEWPSQAWVKLSDPYYDLTKAPETLQPLTPP